MNVREGLPDGKKRASICFVLLYFGKWPHYWNLWAQSVAANPEVNFMIITNLAPPAYSPDNLQFVKMNLQEVVSRFRKALGFDITVAGFQKLCDFRPFFGMAFEDLLNAFDYWGYCDMDVVFGDLSPILEAASCSKYDVISPWSHTIGHCTLLRNSPSVNKAGLQIPNLESRLNEVETTFCDEGGFHDACVTKGSLSFFGANSIQEEWTKERCFLGTTLKPGCLLHGFEQLASFAILCGEKRVTVIEGSGRPREVLYFHFMAGKSKRFWRNYAGEVSHSFSFTPYGYVPRHMPASELATFHFRLNCLLSRLRSNSYKFLHHCFPRPVRVQIKWVLRQIRGISRT
jgi:hypothetical protein